MRRRRCRADLYAYRQHINRNLTVGWWQRQLALELQQFARQLFAGGSPQLLILAPPQHGKSSQIVDVISWILGHDPDLKAIYASFSERLGIRANSRLQRIFASQGFQEIFPETRLKSSGGGLRKAASPRQRTSKMLEFTDHEGYFRNTTVGGAITGESADLGIIDDPIKGREQANSRVIRDKIWDWFLDDFSTRFSEGAGLLVILTHWHVDDMAARLIKSEPRLRLLSYPALAEEADAFRQAGEALFPQHKSKRFLLRQKARMAPESWQALYQQKPVARGGNLIKIDDLLRHSQIPPLKWRAIYVDTAQKTGERHDYSVFQHWGAGCDGKAYLLDQARGRFEAPELTATALAFWRKSLVLDVAQFGYLRKMDVEDKVSGTGLMQTLARKAIPLAARRRRSDKYTRALDITPSIAAGLISIPEKAAWLADFIDELTAFPDGAHDDQVDPFIDAVSDICLQGGYTLDNI